MALKKRNSQNVNASSMADIAFLLLIFFLVTTKIDVDKGVYVRLPPKVDDVPVEIRERNVYNVVLNSNDKLLVEEEPMSHRVLRIGKFRQGVKKYIFK